MEGILLFFALLFGSVIISFFLICGMSWLLSLCDDDEEYCDDEADDNDEEEDDEADDNDDEEDDDDDDEDDDYDYYSTSSHILNLTTQMSMLSTIFY